MTCKPSLITYIQIIFSLSADQVFESFALRHAPLGVAALTLRDPLFGASKALI